MSWVFTVWVDIGVEPIWELALWGKPCSYLLTVHSHTHTLTEASQEKCDFFVCGCLWFPRLPQMHDGSDGWVDTWSKECGTFAFALPSTVAPRCLLLLCCCSHSLAAKRWHRTLGIVWHRAKLGVWGGGVPQSSYWQSNKVKWKDAHNTNTLGHLPKLVSVSHWELWQ